MHRVCNGNAWCMSMKVKHQISRTSHEASKLEKGKKDEVWKRSRVRMSCFEKNTEESEQYSVADFQGGPYKDIRMSNNESEWCNVITVFPVEDTLKEG